MNISLIRCDNFDEYVQLVDSFSKERLYPIIKDNVIDRLLKSLHKENLSYNIIKSDYNKNYFSNPEGINDNPDLGEAVFKHNSAICDTNDIAIAFENNQYYAWVALHHAKLENKKLYLVSSIEEAINIVNINKSKFVTFVASNQNLKTKEIIQLQEMQNERIGNKNEFFFSILTARNYYSLISLVIRNNIFKANENRKFIHLNRLDFDRKEIINMENISIYPYNKANSMELKMAVIDNAVDITTIIGHGRNDLIWLSDGVICGKGSDMKDDEDEISTNKPACFYNGNCFKSDLEIVHGHDIHSRHIFANCCFSAQLTDAFFGDDFNIMFSFLDGHAVSYFGSTCIIDGKEFLNYYYLAIICSGIPFGIAAAYVNRAFCDLMLGHKWSFYLIGDSSFSLPSSSKPIVLKVGNILFDQDDTFKQKFEIPYDVHLITLEIQESELVTKHYNLQNRLSLYNQSRQKLYGVFRKIGEKTLIDVFSESIIERGELHIFIKKGIQLDLTAINKLEQILILGLNPDNKFKSYITESKDSVLKLSKTYRNYMDNLSHIYDLVYKKYDRIHDRVMNLSNIVTSYLIEQTHSKGFALEDFCMENGMSYKNNFQCNEKDLCSRCGQELFALNFSHDVYPSIERIYYYCVSCGIVKDVPSRSIGLYDIYFEGPSEFSTNNDFTQSLVIANNSGRELYGYAGIAVVGGEQSGISPEDPIRKLSILPHSTVQIHYKVMSSENTPPHVYYLRAKVFVNGDIISIKKNISAITKRMGISN